MACAGGGGGGGLGGPVDPPTGPTAFSKQAGLDSVAPGPGTLRIDFTPPPTADFEVAVFLSTSRPDIFAGTPRVPAAGSTTLTVNGLANGVQLFVGLGIRPTGGGSYVQTGPTLTVTPGNPLYVDPAAASGVGDGSLGNPYSLIDGVLNAFVSLLSAPSVSVNLWLRGGTYVIHSTLPVAAGVDIYGGFGPAFDLATRDITNTPTIWSVPAGQFGMVHSDEQLNANLPVIVDGVRMTGNGVGRIGIDSNGTDPTSLELRSVVITDMVDRGLRLRNLGLNSFNIVMTNCQSSRNGAEGLNAGGAFDYAVFNCVFASNAQEGFDLKNLVPEAGGIARLSLSSSQFFGNGAEGVDCTLGLPLGPTTGSFDIAIRGCAFERNVLAGCLIDGDFESAPGYSADVILRESIARGNAGHGFHLDLDGPLDATQHFTAFLHRLRATSNGLDGLYVTSESRAGLIQVSTSALVGNMGAGIHIEGPPATPGNRSVLVSHCLFASNFGAGMISRDIPASAVSSILYQQASPFDANTLSVSNVSSNDPAALGFANAPEEYARVVARTGAVLTLATAPSIATSAPLELADDGTGRSASTISGTQVTLSEAPDDFGVPGLLGVFAPGATDVNESYALLGGSIALGAGLNGADAGPEGSAAPGMPGLTDAMPAELFYPLAATPDLFQLVGANQALQIQFSKTLDGASANGTTVRARRGGNALNISLQTAGATLTIGPPGGGWGAGDFRVELDGLRASDGTELSAAVVLPYQR